MSQQITLYNPALVPKVQLFSGRVVMLVLAGVVVLSAAAWGLAALDASRVAREERAQAARLVQLRGEVASLGQQVTARKPAAQLQSELDNLEALQSARNEVLGLIQTGGLGDTRGVSEYFRAFARQSTEGLWLTGFSITDRGNDIVIHGRTLDADLVPTYLGKLRREKSLRGHGFESLSVYQPPEASVSQAGKAAPPAFLEFRMATSARGSGADLQAASKPGGAR